MRRLETDLSGKVFVCTGVRGFDRQLGEFRVGGPDRSEPACAVANVRPFTCTSDITGWYLPGHLRDRDLDKIPGLPDAVAAAAVDAGRRAHVLVYEFRHADGPDTVVHGHVVTLDRDGHHELVGSFPARGRDAAAVIGEMEGIVSNPPGTAARVRDVLAPARLSDMLAFLARVPAAPASAIRDVAGELSPGTVPGGARQALAIWKELVRGAGGYCLSLTAEGAQVKSRCDGLLAAAGHGAEAAARSAMATLEHMATSRRKHGPADPDLSLASFVVAAGRAPAPVPLPGQDEAPYPAARPLA